MPCQIASTLNKCIIFCPYSLYTSKHCKKEHRHINKDKEVEAYKSGYLTPEEQTKYEIAQELGILDKVLEGGWKSLSAKETGRIGGIMARKKPKK